MSNLSEKQLELACRFLCKFRGLKPDEYVGCGFVQIPRWQTFASEIEKRVCTIQADEAIKESLK